MKWNWFPATFRDSIYNLIAYSPLVPVLSGQYDFMIGLRYSITVPQRQQPYGVSCAKNLYANLNDAPNL